MYEKKIRRVYYAELGVSFAVYFVLLTASMRLARPMGEGTLRTALLVSPMIGFGLMLWAIARSVRRMDEYMSRRLLETVSLAAAITAGLTFTYGFLETAGFPRLSMFTVWMVMGGSWLAVCTIRGLLKR